MATDSSWNWNFRRIGEGGSGRHYYKFWNNLVAWLTDDPETRLLQLETDKERYEEGEEVLVRVRAFQDDYNPAVGSEVLLDIKNQSGPLATISLKTDENGEARYKWTRIGKVTVMPGDVVLGKEDGEIGRASCRERV